MKKICNLYYSIAAEINVEEVNLYKKLTKKKTKNSSIKSVYRIK